MNRTKNADRMSAMSPIDAKPSDTTFGEEFAITQKVLAADPTMRTPWPAAFWKLLANYDALIRFSGGLLRSGLLPSSFKTPEAVALVIMNGLELGIGPVTALKWIYPIPSSSGTSSSPTIAPALALALARRTHELEDIQIKDDGHKCEVTVKRKGFSPVTTTFSMEDADRIKYWDSKKNSFVSLSSKSNWVNYPTQMRRWRAIGDNLKITFPDVILGMLFPDEAGMVTDEEGNPVSGAASEVTIQTNHVAQHSATSIEAPKETTPSVSKLQADQKPQTVDQTVSADALDAAERIIQELRQASTNIAGGAPRDPEIQRLAAVVHKGIAPALLDGENPNEFRHAIYSLVAGETIHTGTQLTRPYCVAMLMRWADPQSERGWAPNSRAKTELAVLVAKIRARKEQANDEDTVQGTVDEEGNDN